MDTRQEIRSTFYTSAAQENSYARIVFAWALGVLAIIVVSAPAHAFTRVGGIVGTSVTQVSGGLLHTCDLTTDSVVECWGHNAYGELGDGSTTDRSNPKAVPSLSGNIVSIAAGGYHTCALTTSGGVKCWGRNSHGEIGNNDTSDVYTPENVSGLSSDIASITSGYAHTCALTVAGKVMCWGGNGAGELGNGSNADSWVPVSVSGLSDVIAIAAGGLHTCALKSKGDVWCWGAAQGIGGAASSSTPVKVNGLSHKVTAIAAGGYHSCALYETGSVSCWGNNAHGELGNDSTADSSFPVSVVGLSDTVTSIAANSSHTCAVINKRLVQCWGLNSYGELGDGTTVNSPTAVMIPNQAILIELLGLGGAHTCGVTWAGAVQCWGYNGTGQLGDGTTTDNKVSVNVRGKNTLTSHIEFDLSSTPRTFSVAEYHACAITRDGGAMCWGYNGSGELGNGTTENSWLPVSVVSLSGRVKALVAGSSHTCALTPTKLVECWGYNEDGELGRGPGDTISLVPLTALVSDVMDISNSGPVTYVLTTNGEVWSWGDGDEVYVLKPHMLSSPYSDFASVVLGGTNICGVRAAGDVYCWGDNVHGQLGNGTTTRAFSTDPTKVVGLSSKVTSLTVGSYHSCVLTEAGPVWCWGDNTEDNLGNDHRLPYATAPVNVLDLPTGVVSVATRGRTTCTLTFGGQVSCWGSDSDGQRGDGPTANPLATTVSGLSSGVTSVGVGYASMCAVKDTDATYCWGKNQDGILGLDPAVISGSDTPLIMAHGGQVIIPNLPVDVALSSTTTLTAVTTSDLPVAYDTWTPSTCSITGNVLTANAVGVCGVRVTREGGGDFAAAPAYLQLIHITDGDLIFADSFD